MSDSKDDDNANNNNGIQTFLRIRPAAGTTYFHRDDIDLNSIAVKLPKHSEIINNSRSGYSFSFGGGILDEKATQKEVFLAVGKPALRNALGGYNSTIFAYGQTGSGKTFTITGGPERYDDRGLIPRSLAYLFKSIKNDQKNGTSYSCYISYLEIYNEYGYDLLQESMKSDNSSSFGEIEVPKVTMLEDEDGNFHFKNLSMHLVSTEEDALNLLFLGDTNRAIAATEMNQNSTRSHCIFSIVLEKRMAGADTVTRSKLNIVDLAGSERVSRSNSAGQTLREAKYINSSLFFLEMVIVALHEKEKKRKDVHIPYRNSMMTSVLRDSLGGNCKTMMIATISPESQHTDESVSTCHFAQRVALVKNSASINEEVEPALVIQRLKAEVRRLREEVEFLSGKNDDDDDSSCDGNEEKHRGGSTLSQDQINELTDSIQRYVQDGDESSQLDFCGGISLPKIRTVCSVFKSMLLESKANSFEVADDGGSNSDSSDEESSSLAEKENKRNPLPIGATIRGSAKKERRHQAQKHQRVDSVCGVAICRDKRVIDEPNTAFNWFREQHPSAATTEKTKNSLKMKYTEAKNAGKSIDEIRSRISHHKEAISKLRKSYAISLVSGNQDDSMNESDFTSQEKHHTDAIEREKTIYKDTLERLRGLKSTIENSQKSMKEDRLKLQSDFDTWYHQVCYEDSKTGDSTLNEIHSQSTNESSSRMEARHTTRCDNRDEAQSKILEVKTGNTTKHSSTAEDSQNEFKLPPGIKLTGNPEADEDIIAFYKAKELLLSRAKR